MFLQCIKLYLFMVIVISSDSNLVPPERACGLQTLHLLALTILEAIPLSHSYYHKKSASRKKHFCPSLSEINGFKGI